MAKPKSRPLPQVISVICGYCHVDEAEVILPDKTLSCKNCAAKMGVGVTWKISNERLMKAHKEIETKVGEKVELWKFAALLGIETSSRTSAAVYVSALMRDRKIPPEISESAMQLEQLEAGQLRFMIEQIEMR